MLFSVGFIAMFVIGGLSGIYLGFVAIDIHASDTYFVVAHIHYVLFGGSVITIFAGIYYWFPKMTGRFLGEGLGQLHFWLRSSAYQHDVLPDALPRAAGMSRRVADYADRFADFNLFISIASFGLGASTDHLPLQLRVVVDVRPARRSEPVAREHARVAGVVAAADLQLRRDPAGRRRPVRVRRSRCAPRDLRCRQARAGRRGLVVCPTCS